MVILVTIGSILVLLGATFLIRPGLITDFEGLGVRMSAPAGLIVIALGLAAIVFPFTQYYKPSASQDPTPTSTPRNRDISISTAPPIDFAQGCPVNGSFPVEVLRVKSRDGKPGVSGDFIVDVLVKTPADSGHSYWLFSKVTNQPGQFVYVAKANISTSVGEHEAGVMLPKSPPGSVRDLFIGDGDPSALGWLQDNNKHDGDPSWDENRNTLHGVLPVSNTCTVTKTRS